MVQVLGNFRTDDGRDSAAKATPTGKANGEFHVIAAADTGMAVWQPTAACKRMFL